MNDSSSTECKQASDSVVISGSGYGPNEKKTKAKAETNNFWRILSYSTTLDRCSMAAGAICAAGAGAALPIMFIVFGSLVEQFNGYFTPDSSVDEAEFRASISQSALYIVYIFIAKFVLGYISLFAFRMAGIRISAAIRLAYLTALFDQSISFIDKLPAGSATDVMTNVANTVQAAISDKLGALVQGIALILAAYIVGFAYAWSLTLISSSPIVFLILISSIVLPQYFKYHKLVMENNSKASGVAGEVLRGIRTIKSLCAEDDAMARHKRWIELAQVYGLKRSIWVTIQYWPAFFAPYSNMALTFWAGAKLYGRYSISNAGDIIIVLFSLMIVVNGIGNAFAPLSNISKASAASVACFQVIDAPRPKHKGLKDPEVSADQNIVFHDVGFSYPSRPRVQILNGFSLVIPAGKITALVGPSGCGKSTLVALLERWYDLSFQNTALPSNDDADKSNSEKQSGVKEQEKGNGAEEQDTGDSDPIFQNLGHISICGQNIEDVDRQWWRAQIGLVQQEPVLFNGSIFENVANGLRGSRFEDEDADSKLKMVKEACEEAFASEFVSRLPDGYDTLVGEDGIKLSGGQRQRLAIARSIIKRPAILILDEATSSIDVHGERLVAAALERASRGRTTIMIAHRLSTIKGADHIVVLRQGSVAEQGTHEELISNSDGLYAGLVQAQTLALGTSDADEGIITSAAQRDLTNGQGDHLSSDEGKAESTEDEKTTESRPRQRGFFRSVGVLLYEQRKYYIFGCLVLLGCMGAGACTPLQAYLFANLIVVFQYTGSELVSRASFWALWFFVLALCVGLCYAVIGYCSNTLSVRVSTAYRDSYFESVLRKPISWFDEEDHSIGALTSQIGADPKELEEVLGPNIVFPVIAIFSLVGSVIISFVFGWKLTLVVFFAALPVILISTFLRIRYELKFDEMNAAVFGSSSKFAAETISAFRTVSALTMEKSILDRYRELLHKHTHDAFMKGRFTVLVFSLSDSLELCSMALAFWYGGQLLATREYDVLQFFIIYSAIVQGGQAIGTFLAMSPNVARATAAANRILFFRHISEPLTPGQYSSLDSEQGHSVEFRNVTFAYPTRKIPVYNDLSFKIDAGQYIAVVGPSGCGKTTIISLLERFYSPTAGQILINGQNLSDISLTPYRSSCGLVTQEPTLFEGTIRSNLTLGLPSSPSDLEIEKSCRDAEIWDFVTSLPQGLDTPILAGTHASFSGGQKQRLCIARALLRRPRLLLLDEATNSLDSVSESLIRKAIDRIAGDAERGVTVVAVAHRLATVQNAHRILVMGEGGVLVESGSHTELVKRKGVYWGMCREQALDA